MSHITQGEVKITDLDALDKVCTEAGVRLVRGQTTFKRWRGTDTCDHAIVLPNGKHDEIGLIRREDGWVLAADWSMMREGMETLAGVEGHKLEDSYSAEFTTRFYQQDGFMVTRSVNEEGEIILECER